MRKSYQLNNSGDNTEVPGQEDLSPAPGLRAESTEASEKETACSRQSRQKNPPAPVR